MNLLAQALTLFINGLYWLGAFMPRRRMSVLLARQYSRKAGDDEKTLVARAAAALAGFEHETKKQCACRA